MSDTTRRNTCRAEGCEKEHGEACHIVLEGTADDPSDVCWSHTADECKYSTYQPTGDSDG